MKGVTLISLEVMKYPCTLNLLDVTVGWSLSVNFRDANPPSYSTTIYYLSNYIVVVALIQKSMFESICVKYLANCSWIFSSKEKSIMKFFMRTLSKEQSRV